jgi:hypothetical protein
MGCSSARRREEQTTENKEQRKELRSEGTTEQKNKTQVAPFVPLVSFILFVRLFACSLVRLFSFGCDEQLAGAIMRAAETNLME